MANFDLAVRGCECNESDEHTHPYVEEYYLLRYGMTEEEANSSEVFILGDWKNNIILKEHLGDNILIKETEHLCLVEIVE